MADKDKKDEAPSYPAPAMTEADHRAAAKFNEEEAAKNAPKASDKTSDPPKGPNAAGHFAAPKKES
jgi:hypothetical protein